jgi:hypothetical protein
MWHTYARSNFASVQSWTSWIFRTFPHIFVPVTTSHPKCWETWREWVPYIVWWTHENVSLDGILRLLKCLWYPFAAACALPLQNPCMKCMSQYLQWESTEGIIMTRYNYKNDNRWVWSHGLNWPAYGLAWQSAQNGPVRCTDNMLNRYSTWNQKRPHFFMLLFPYAFIFMYKYGYIDVN